MSYFHFLAKGFTPEESWELYKCALETFHPWWYVTAKLIYLKLWMFFNR